MLQTIKKNDRIKETQIKLKMQKTDSQLQTCALGYGCNGSMWSLRIGIRWDLQNVNKYKFGSIVFDWQ